MNGKTSKAKPKMVDVMKPKRATSDDATSAPLVIQSRPIIGRAMSASNPSEDQPTVPDPSMDQKPETTSAPVLPSQSKRTLIVPISDGLDKASGASTDTAVTPGTTKVIPEASVPEKPAPAEAPEDEGPAKKPQPAATTKEQATEETEKPTADAKAADEEPEDDKAAEKGEKPTAETEKAVAEAAAAAKRERELESLIDSKQFYVPINAVARKREVKHSALMTVLVLLLAFVLIDLMLDSGLILLAERIPHTHFFTVSSIDQK